MNEVKYRQLSAIAHELRQLQQKAQTHIDEQVSSERYVYADTYRGWTIEYNRLVNKYNTLTAANLSARSVSDYELSTTKKTVRTEIAKSFVKATNDLASKIESEANAEQNREIPIPVHQMRVCFKTGVHGCPMKPPKKMNRVFVAMPFSSDYRDSFEYGVKVALEQKGIEYFKADNEVSNKDIMCKICRELQSCGKVIANISGLNPNVMLELGLAYGLGKEVIVIKDVKTTAISDLGSIEYIEYAHAGELQKKLFQVL